MRKESSVSIQAMAGKHFCGCFLTVLRSYFERNVHAASRANVTGTSRSPSSSFNNLQSTLATANRCCRDANPLLCATSSMRFGYLLVNRVVTTLKFSCYLNLTRICFIMPTITPIDLSLKALTSRASWIRDVCDPRIARGGPVAMDPDDALTLHDLFKALQINPLSLATIRASRIHFAVLCVAGMATRWPAKLVDECDNVIELWEKKYGPLKKIAPPLYSPGARLWQVVDATDLSREVRNKLRFRHR